MGYPPIALSNRVEDASNNQIEGGCVMKKLILVSMISLCLFSLPSMPLLAQDKPADNMEILRESARSEVKLVIAKNMQLTESEAKAFWPVYDSFQAEMKKLNDTRLQIIQDYAKSFDSMTDETAKKILERSMANEKERLKLKESYLPKFQKVLPAKKVGRFYQLQNKIEAIFNFELAAQIPLVK
jgi:hypothetical protein